MATIAALEPCTAHDGLLFIPFYLSPLLDVKFLARLFFLGYLESESDAYVACHNGNLKLRPLAWLPRAAVHRHCPPSFRQTVLGLLSLGASQRTNASLPRHARAAATVWRLPLELLYMILVEASYPLWSLDHMYALPASPLEPSLS
jgi:hypothetical protein